MSFWSRASVAELEVLKATISTTTAATNSTIPAIMPEPFGVGGAPGHLEIVDLGLELLQSRRQVVGGCVGHGLLSWFGRWKVGIMGHMPR